MTYKEAIEIIQSDFEMACIPGEHLEAYNMAIEALRDKEERSHYPSSLDMVMDQKAESDRKWKEMRNMLGGGCR